MKGITKTRARRETVLATPLRLAALALVVVVWILVGVPTEAATSSPSGQSMPTQVLAGYQQVVAQDFTGTTVPSGWHPYYGRAGTDTAGWWDPSHVTVGNGLLTLRTYRDSAHAGPNSPWVEGGIDLWPNGVLTHGEYLVRARVTSAVGVTEVMILWHYHNRPGHREIDFNESNGTNVSTATFTWGRNARRLQATAPSVDLTQWHTWGVVVTPKTITYTLDGRTWATMPQHVHGAYDLALQQQVWACNNTSERTCPSTATPSEVDMQIDWAVVYAPTHPRR